MEIHLDEAAEASLKAMDTSAEHMVEHHREHMARACGCHFRRYGMTAMRAPDGTLLIISEPSPLVFAITARVPSGSVRR